MITKTIQRNSDASISLGSNHGCQKRYSSLQLPSILELDRLQLRFIPQFYLDLWVGEATSFSFLLAHSGYCATIDAECCQVMPFTTLGADDALALIERRGSIEAVLLN